MVHINGYRLLFRLNSGQEISVPAGQISRITFGNRAAEPRKPEKPKPPAPAPVRPARSEKEDGSPAGRVNEVEKRTTPAVKATEPRKPESPPDRGIPQPGRTSQVEKIARASERQGRATGHGAPANLFAGESSAAVFETDTVLLARRPVKVTLAPAGAGEENLIQYSLNESEFAKYSGPFTLSETGLYQIRYFSVDPAGNREVLRHRTIQIDRLNPELRFDFAGQVFRDRQAVVFTSTPFVFVRAEDPHAGVAGVRCLRAAETIDLSAEGGMFTLEQANRTVTVVCQARDRAGNQAERTVYVQHDQAPPRVSWGSSDPDRFFNTGARMQFFAEDEGSGIGTLRLLVDGFAHELPADARSFAPADFESRPGAEREFVVIAVDRTGNEARSPALRLRVDKQAPVSELKLEP